MQFLITLLSLALLVQARKDQVESSQQTLSASASDADTADAISDFLNDNAGEESSTTSAIPQVTSAALTAGPTVGHASQAKTKHKVASTTVATTRPTTAATTKTTTTTTTTSGTTTTTTTAPPQHSTTKVHGSTRMSTGKPVVFLAKAQQRSEEREELKREVYAQVKAEMEKEFQVELKQQLAKARAKMDTLAKVTAATSSTTSTPVLATTSTTTSTTSVPAATSTSVELTSTKMLPTYEKTTTTTTSTTTSLTVKVNDFGTRAGVSGLARAWSSTEHLAKRLASLVGTGLVSLAWPGREELLAWAETTPVHRFLVRIDDWLAKPGSHAAIATTSKPELQHKADAAADSAAWLAEALIQTPRADSAAEQAKVEAERLRDSHAEDTWSDFESQDNELQAQLDKDEQS